METAAKYKPNLEVVSDSEELASHSVGLFVTRARQAIQEARDFRVAISGGHTPERFFQLLGELPQARELPWDKVQLFWVDERYVPPDSPHSNYKLAADTFLKRVAIPEGNVHRIATELADFEEAARLYEQTIRRVFRLGEGQVPVFDLIILGMGVEGHTGSLFPNSFAAFDTADLACVVYVMDDKLNRITLTHPVLRAASRVAVLVCGKEKAGILKEVLTSEPDEVRYPIHALWPILDRITWLVDSAAAELL